MIDDFAKEYLHRDLCEVREAWYFGDVFGRPFPGHVLTETNRHAGHADILREQLDGAVGFDTDSTAQHG